MLVELLEVAAGLHVGVGLVLRPVAQHLRRRCAVALLPQTVLMLQVALRGQIVHRLPDAAELRLDKQGVFGDGERAVRAAQRRRRLVAAVVRIFALLRHDLQEDNAEAALLDRKSYNDLKFGGPSRLPVARRAPKRNVWAHLCTTHNVALRFTRLSHFS